MKRIIYAIIAMLALVFALGTMGAYANENIGFCRAVLQFGICILVAWFALKRADD